MTHAPCLMLCSPIVSTTWVITSGSAAKNKLRLNKLLLFQDYHYHFIFFFLVASAASDLSDFVILIADFSRAPTSLVFRRLRTATCIRHLLSVVCFLEFSTCSHRITAHVAHQSFMSLRILFINFPPHSLRLPCLSVSSFSFFSAGQRVKLMGGGEGWLEEKKRKRKKERNTETQKCAHWRTLTYTDPEAFARGEVDLEKRRGRKIEREKRNRKGNARSLT